MYGSYSDTALMKAYLAVVDEGMSVRRAAESFRVPRSTLHDRVTGKVSFGAKSGPERYLTDDEERELVQFIESCAGIGFSRTKQQILAIIRQVMEKKGVNAPVSEGWWASFRRRHPNLSLRMPEEVSHARRIGTKPELISKYFDLLEDTLYENDLIDQPCSIFNMDETGMPLDPSPPKVICIRGSKHPVCTTSGDKSQITVVSCCNAGGYTMPPMVIYDRQKLKAELTRGEVPGTIYGLSKNGWIDSELFDQWFCEHFLRYAPPTRPVLLLLDGHSTHYNPVTIERAAEEKVIMFCLPPHSSHKTQPLDKGCFGPLKQYWRQECHSFITRNPGRVITRYDFSQLFSNAWSKAMTITNVVSGFKTTGIYPLDRSTILPITYPESPAVRPQLSHRTGLNYIPLFSPNPHRHAPVESDQESSQSDSDDDFSPHFTEEEVMLFTKRFEEGFDVPDPRYELWLSTNHGN